MYYYLKENYFQVLSPLPEMKTLLVLVKISCKSDTEMFP